MSMASSLHRRLSVFNPRILSLRYAAVLSKELHNNIFRSNLYLCRLCCELQALAPVFALIAPRYQFTGSSKNGPAVTRDPEALRVKYSDPLVFTGSIRVRTGYEILRLTAYLQQHLRRVTVPLLVLHGADDMVTDPEGSRRLHREASTPDKAIRLYDGLLHDLLIEPEKEVVLGDIVDWLSPRI